MSEAKIQDVRIGAWALVELEDGSQHRGVIYTVDPEAGHVLLLQPCDGDDPCAVTPLVLMGNSVERITQEHADSHRGAQPDVLAADAVLHRIADDSDDDAPPPSARIDTADEATIERRRAKLCSLLREQRAPFEELPKGDLLVLGCLRVAPPYTPRACRCENEVVLDRFTDMLRSNGLV